MATLNSGVCASVTPDAVQEIIDTDLTDARINAFINLAYFTTIPLAGLLDDCGAGDALCAIQLLLAAHFLTIYDRQLKSQSVAGEWSATFLGKDGLGDFGWVVEFLFHKIQEALLARFRLLSQHFVLIHVLHLRLLCPFGSFYITEVTHVTI